MCTALKRQDRAWRQIRVVVMKKSEPEGGAQDGWGCKQKGKVQDQTTYVHNWLMQPRDRPLVNGELVQLIKLRLS